MNLKRYIVLSCLSCYIFMFLYFTFFPPESDANGYGLISIFAGVIIGILLSINNTLNKMKN